MMTKCFMPVLLAMTVGVYCAMGLTTKQVCLDFIVNADCFWCRYQEGIMCCDCVVPLPGQQPESGFLTCDIAKKELHVGCTLIGMKNDHVYEIIDKVFDIDGESIKIEPRSNKPAPIRRQIYNAFMSPLRVLVK